MGEKNEANQEVLISLKEAEELFELSDYFIYKKLLPILKEKNAVMIKGGIYCVPLQKFMDVLIAYPITRKSRLSLYPLFLTDKMLRALGIPEKEIKDALRKCPSGIFLSEKLFFRGKDPIGLFLLSRKRTLKRDYFVFPIRGLGTDLGYICYDTLFTTSLLNFYGQVIPAAKTSTEHLKIIISLFSHFLAFTTIGDASLKQRMEWQDEVYRYLISKVNELSKMVSEEREEVQDSINKVQEILKEIEKEYIAYKKSTKEKFGVEQK